MCNQFPHETSNFSEVVVPHMSDTTGRSSLEASRREMLLRGGLRIIIEEVCESHDRFRLAHALLRRLSCGGFRCVGSRARPAEWGGNLTFLLFFESPALREPAWLVIRLVEVVLRKAGGG